MKNKEIFEYDVYNAVDSLDILLSLHSNNLGMSVLSDIQNLIEELTSILHNYNNYNKLDS